MLPLRREKADLAVRVSRALPRARSVRIRARMRGASFQLPRGLPLGWRTDLLFVAFDGEVLDRGEYLVARNAGNPRWYWGNFLLLRGAPTPPTEALLERFSREFASQPESAHVALAWTEPSAHPRDAAGWEPLGFTAEHGVVRAATREELLAPRRPALSLELRTARSERDWAELVANHLRTHASVANPEARRRFIERRIAQWRALSEAGHGDWWCLRVGGELVSDCGLYFDGEGTARFQAVGTAPAWRGKGLARWLVHSVAEEALRGGHAERAVLIGEEGATGDAIYAALGFRHRENAVGVFRPPPAQSAG